MLTVLRFLNSFTAFNLIHLYTSYPKEQLEKEQDELNKLMSKEKLIRSRRSNIRIRRLVDKIDFFKGIDNILNHDALKKKEISDEVSKNENNISNINPIIIKNFYDYAMQNEKKINKIIRKKHKRVVQPKDSNGTVNIYNYNIMNINLQLINNDSNKEDINYTNNNYSLSTTLKNSNTKKGKRKNRLPPIKIKDKHISEVIKEQNEEQDISISKRNESSPKKKTFKSFFSKEYEDEEANQVFFCECEDIVLNKQIVPLKDQSKELFDKSNKLKKSVRFKNARSISNHNIEPISQCINEEKVSPYRKSFKNFTSKELINVINKANNEKCNKCDGIYIANSDLDHTINTYITCTPNQERSQTERENKELSLKIFPKNITPPFRKAKTNINRRLAVQGEFSDLHKFNLINQFNNNTNNINNNNNLNTIETQDNERINKIDELNKRLATTSKEILKDNKRNKENTMSNKVSKKIMLKVVFIVLIMLFILPYLSVATYSGISNSVFVFEVIIMSNYLLAGSFDIFDQFLNSKLRNITYQDEIGIEIIKAGFNSREDMCYLGLCEKYNSTQLYYNHDLDEEARYSDRIVTNTPLLYIMYSLREEHKLEYILTIVKIAFVAIILYIGAFLLIRDLTIHIIAPLEHAHKYIRKHRLNEDYLYNNAGVSLQKMLFSSNSKNKNDNSFSPIVNFYLDSSLFIIRSLGKRSKKSFNFSFQLLYG